ncbi:hypothetical protein CR194_17980 [Salipaludibacillus keqinensis]|uniref:DUF2628 domain-containing protein n=1 Tax=Salipaludibacillus keqinensis TaxID=2045207 RepID=A0A323T930_9BACI|nr:DUF2628 domain-containing protein [Salipaludibacillus keqinensis]PYZ92081.1 hypothetical protein CR194_17980 [Salipaludibacillus keqinensis]
MNSHHSNKSKMLLSISNPIIQKIVGENSSYYHEKWTKHQDPLTYSGWNWAAFFFTPFWLAYRHMYLWVIVFFLLYLTGIILVAFFPAVIHMGFLPAPSLWIWQLTYPILVNIFFGAKGNAFYSQRVAKLALFYEGKLQKPMAPLFTRTGRSWISAIIVPAVIWIFLFIPYQTVESWTFNPSLAPGVYVYSDDSPTPTGILDVEETPSFQKYEARINFLYYGEEPVGDRSFMIKLFYKESPETDDWALERERSYGIFSSNRVTLGLIDAEDPASKTGEYLLEIYIDDQLQAEEKFEITAPNQPQ